MKRKAIDTFILAIALFPIVTFLFRSYCFDCGSSLGMPLTFFQSPGGLILDVSALKPPTFNLLAIPLDFLFWWGMVALFWKVVTIPKKLIIRIVVFFFLLFIVFFAFNLILGWLTPLQFFKTQMP